MCYICGPSDLSNTINVIYLANFNHNLSCIAALRRRLYVQWIHTHNLNTIYLVNTLPLKKRICFLMYFGCLEPSSAMSCDLHHVTQAEA